MARDINYESIVKKVQNKFPEFKDYEIIELCEWYLESFPKKTKLESVIKSLDKYITKEFSLDEETTNINQDKNNSEKQYSLDNIPKSFFNNWKLDKDTCLLKVLNISKTIWKTFLFDEANLQINWKDKIALIWRNWAGKSTLLKILIWIEEIEWWEIEKSKWLTIWYLSQDLFWNSRENSLEEEMLTTFSDITSKINRLNEIKSLLDSWIWWDEVSLVQEKSEIEEWLKNNDWYNKYAQQTEIIKYFGFNEQQMKLKISNLSWWEQTKVQIAKFFLQNVDLLILDEPTNHLDIEWIMFLENFCKLWQKALICISHDKKFINNVFDKIVEISERKLITYYWNYDKYIEKKQENYELQLKNYNNQQKELDKQNEFIERFRYKASKAAQVQSRIKMLEKIDIIEAPTDETTVKNINLNVDIRLPNLIMNLNKLVVWYNSPLISLNKLIEITKDKKIWVIWKNWVGKTTLLKTILGELQPISWEVNINDRIKIWSYSQVAEELNRENTIINELVWPWISQTEVRTILWWLLIVWEKVDQKISTLSGWERAKVALAKMLLEKPHLIIMDEPTNHLDLYSKESIKYMLQKFPGVTLIVSHDRDLLENISNELWVVKNWKLEQFQSLDRWFLEIYN